MKHCFCPICFESRILFENWSRCDVFVTDAPATKQGCKSNALQASHSTPSVGRHVANGLLAPKMSHVGDRFCSALQCPFLGKKSSTRVQPVVCPAPSCSKSKHAEWCWARTYHLPNAWLLFEPVRGKLAVGAGFQPCQLGTPAKSFPGRGAHCNLEIR